jgi:hypothetical protein
MTDEEDFLLYCYEKENKLISDNKAPDLLLSNFVKQAMQYAIELNGLRIEVLAGGSEGPYCFDITCNLINGESFEFISANSYGEQFFLYLDKGIEQLNRCICEISKEINHYFKVVVLIDESKKGNTEKDFIENGWNYDPVYEIVLIPKFAYKVQAR